VDLKAVASLTSEPKGYGAAPLLVRKDLFESGRIAKPADLKGRKIGLNLGRGVAECLLSQALARDRLTVDDIQIVTIPIPELPAAPANKSIDATILSYPYVAGVLEDGSAVVLLGGDEIVDTPQINVLYFGWRLLDPANRQIGVRFLIACLKGARELHGDGWRTDENVAILSKHTSIPASAILKSTPYFCDPDGEINEASVEKIQAYYVAHGYTELPRPLALLQVIDESILTEAVNRLGQFKPRD
jgi:NitT/TauT family transport system substrate-binding protein